MLFTGIYHQAREHSEFVLLVLRRAVGLSFYSRCLKSLILFPATLLANSTLSNVLSLYV